MVPQKEPWFQKPPVSFHDWRQGSGQGQLIVSEWLAGDKQGMRNGMNPGIGPQGNHLGIRQFLELEGTWVGKPNLEIYFHGLAGAQARRLWLLLRDATAFETAAWDAAVQEAGRLLLEPETRLGGDGSLHFWWVARKNKGNLLVFVHFFVDGASNTFCFLFVPRCFWF